VSAQVNAKHGLLSRHEPMSRHTSWRVGGPADVFFKPASVAELEDFLRRLSDETPLYWIGLGSNLLVRDGGIRGTVISTTACMRQIERVGETGVKDGSGASCSALARQCVRWQLGPAVFFAGSSGLVGGALAMVAGAFGGETWERVEAVETLDRGGVRRTRPRSVLRVGYRTVQGPADEWFLRATLGLE